MRPHTLTSRRGVRSRSPLTGRSRRRQGDPTSTTGEWAMRHWQQQVEAEARRRLKDEVRGVSTHR